MENFYVNTTVRAPAKNVVAFLEEYGAQAYVLPTQESECVIYEKISDTQDIDYLNRLLESLTAKESCVGLGVANDDSDILYLTLWKNGDLESDYTCSMRFEDMYIEFDEDESGDIISSSDRTKKVIELKNNQMKEKVIKMSNALASAFDLVEVQDDILEVLTNEFVFAADIHKQLAEVLGLPMTSVGWGFKNIDTGESDEYLDMKQLIKVG